MQRKSRAMAGMARAFGNKDSTHRLKLSADRSPPATFGLRGSVLRGGAFLFGRQVASMCLSVIGIVVVTRVIGPESYGAYTTALGVSQYVQTLCQTGVVVFLVRHANEVSERDYGAASGFLLALTLLLTSCIEMGADIVGLWVQVPGFAPLLRALAIVMPLQSLAAIASARLDRALNFHQSAVIEFSGQLAYYLIAVPSALLGYGAWALAFAWIVQQVTYCALVHIAARHAIAFAWDKALIVRMVTYSLQFSAANWLWQLRSLVNPLIVGHILGAESVGYVGLTIRLMELLAVVKTITWRLSIAAFGRIQAEPEKLIRAINEAMQLQTLAIGPMLLGFSWIGGTVLLMVVGERWSPVIDLFPFIALAYLTNAQFNMHASALHVLNRNPQVAIFAILHLAIFAPACAAAVAHVGLVGYGWAEIVALPSYFVLHIAVVRAIGHLQYRLSFIWWLGIALGLFWRELGWWAISAPFVSLLLPESIRQIHSFISAAWQSQRAPSNAEPRSASGPDTLA
jgi:O-antigen/teichoic acid export membrane protein